MGQVLPFRQEPLDPETLALATSTYDRAIVDVANAPEVLREVVAKNIIRLIVEGVRDPNVLYERALSSAGIPA